jgi:hypothetical protein
MFTFDPIDRRQYRMIMIIAAGLLIVIITNFTKFVQVLTSSINCPGVNSLCQSLNNEIPQYASLAAITLFLITVAIATMRRISAIHISNYWVVILSLLVFLDHHYLAGLDAVWSGDFSASIHQLPVPWYLLSAVSLIVLLSFASAGSNYFLDGFWKADPPLGYSLSISSFWLLTLSSPKAIMIIATATDNNWLWQTSYELEQQFAGWLPALVVSPVMPAVIFITCSLLLTLLGLLRHDGQKDTAMANQQNTHRRQSVMQTTKAAQSLNGLKL